MISKKKVAELMNTNEDTVDMYVAKNYLEEHEGGGFLKEDVISLLREKKENLEKVIRKDKENMEKLKKEIDKLEERGGKVTKEETQELLEWNDRVFQSIIKNVVEEDNIRESYSVDVLIQLLEMKKSAYMETVSEFEEELKITEENLQSISF